MKKNIELTNEERVKLKLKNALHYVLSMCEWGASNKVKDVKKTNAWNSFLEERYNFYGKFFKTNNLPLLERKGTFNSGINNNHLVYFFNKKWNYRANLIQSKGNPFHLKLNARVDGVSPLEDSQFDLSLEKLTLLGAAMLTMVRRQGNCGDRSALLAKYLWENNADITRIELTGTSTFDHGFVIVNRAANSNLANPDEWGPAWIVDSWYEDEGLIFPASEFRAKIKDIKDFVIEQYDKLFPKGILGTPPLRGAQEEILTVTCEINLSSDHFDKYPTYSRDPFYPVEYYYRIGNEYPLDFRDKMMDDLQAHKEKFEDCLTEIKMR
ncbi:Uncharacterised protein [Legionella beliardensis]|uniref:Uncharacterized protein n=1 Tax=Legionella beliardensis TaxID=91822 RepID=A0A378I735_9GAMM|nr:hypothetical protein [Legionella beliardensis]STX28244.1 Uncharacterised protein [Legionella beliardensis]